MPEEVFRERERVKELETRLAKISKDVTEANQRENDLRAGLGKKDKEVALIKHELKEAQRKGEQDQDFRKKADSERSEMRKKLDDEINKRTKEQNNHHQVDTRQ